jgi:hypothetical protein
MSNVKNLFSLSPERRAAVQSFCLEQAAHYTEQARRPEGGGAALHLFIAGDNKVELSVCALEPAHAAAMLLALDEVRARLVGVVAAAGLDLNAFTKVTEGAGSNVVALRGR